MCIKRYSKDLRNFVTIYRINNFIIVDIIYLCLSYFFYEITLLQYCYSEMMMLVRVSCLCFTFLDWTAFYLSTH